MEEIAQVYARSLFEVAKEQDKLDVVREQLGQFADALDDNRDLPLFFFSPYFSTEEKKQGLGKALDGADPAVVNFLELLIEKHRMPAIFRIRRALRAAVGAGEQAAAGQDHHARSTLDEATVKSHRRRGSASRPASRSS